MAHPSAVQDVVEPRVVRKRRPYRKLEIQQAAIRLFQEKGYAETSMEDIGAAVGLAGPSIYRHFESKAAILEMAVTAVSSAFWGELEDEVGAPHDPLLRLERLVEIYVDGTFKDPSFTAVWMQARHVLSEELLAEVERTDRRLLAVWVEALSQARPELDRAEAKLLVRGALAMALTMALTRTRMAEQRAAASCKRATLAVLLA